MGILGYFSFLASKYPHVVQTFNVQKSKGSDFGTSLPSQEHYDHIYYDINNFLYLVAQRKKGPITEEEIFVKLYSNLDNVLNLFQPKKTIFLAMDGPGKHYPLLSPLSENMLNASFFFWGGGI